ncbi:hypothetical protein UM93_10265 [Psychromicrobium lacuslunae]|uniref:CAAX prenyl protease 2/Lysostaphin resistance protein A-like domain-containing protein n=1 Tax=Psychromicrobium lacuslunae TaxID=1618207 RepID=A0A0D4C3D1_9MICC|nr:hypothetical protein UM93_10265 [Psychromicrobium lacuslunae]
MSRQLITVGIPALAVAVLLFLSTKTSRGGGLFYLCTFSAAAVYFVAWLLWGNRAAILGPRPVQAIGRGALWGLSLLGVFLLGALVVKSVPGLAIPVQGLLDNARQGPLLLTLLVAVLAGVGEELFFRQLILDQALFSVRQAGTISIVLYLLVTAAMGIPLLVFAALIIGLAAQREKQRTEGLISSIVLHLCWSCGMVLLLPAVFG